MNTDATVSDAPEYVVTQYKESMAKLAGNAIKAINQAIEITQQIQAAGLSTNDLVRVFSTSRFQHEVLDDSRKRFNEIVRMMGDKTIPERFAAEKIKTVKLEDVGRVSVSYRKSASMEDKAKGMGWLKENHPDIITETVNAQTLAAFLSSEFIEKNEDPPEFFKYSTSPFTSITKG